MWIIDYSIEQKAGKPGTKLTGRVSGDELYDTMQALLDKAWQQVVSACERGAGRKSVPWSVRIEMVADDDEPEDVFEINGP